MTLFGKSNAKLSVMAAEFLPDGERLYILVADDDSNINILQYDPEGMYKLPIYASLAHLSTILINGL